MHTTSPPVQISYQAYRKILEASVNRSTQRGDPQQRVRPDDTLNQGIPPDDLGMIADFEFTLGRALGHGVEITKEIGMMTVRQSHRVLCAAQPPAPPTNGDNPPQPQEPVMPDFRRPIPTVPRDEYELVESDYSSDEFPLLPQPTSSKAQAFTLFG